MNKGPPEISLSRRHILGGVVAGLPLSRAARAVETIALGLTPVFVDTDLTLLKTIERELSSRLGTPVTLIKRRTYQEIMAMLLAGQVTAAWICGYPFVRHRHQLSIVVSPIYDGAPLYKAYFIARSDLTGPSLDAFRGRSHAFSDPDSNSGWLVTRHLLAEAGTTPETFFSRSFFTYGHRNVVRAVAAGLADTGSVDGYVWDVLAKREPSLTRQTRVVLRSAPMGFPPIACLSSMRATPTVQALGSVLRGLSEDATGRSILDLLNLDGFGAVEPSLYDTIAAMHRSLPA